MKKHKVQIVMQEVHYYTKTIEVELTDAQIWEHIKMETWEIEKKYNTEIFGDENFETSERSHIITHIK